MAQLRATLHKVMHKRKAAIEEVLHQVINVRSRKDTDVKVHRCDGCEDGSIRWHSAGSHARLQIGFAASY